MTRAEAGFIMLSSHFGNLSRPALTTAQLRILSEHMREARRDDPDRELNYRDLLDAGCTNQLAAQIVELLSQEKELDGYLRKAKKAKCVPLAKIDPRYPGILHERLGLETPGCLWAKGDLSLLKRPMIAVVGSRRPRPEAADFAFLAGQMAAKQGFVLVSGNADGVDSIAQRACLAAGGSVISVVADRLDQKGLCKGMLYLSEDSFDLPFSSARALSRNQVIHALGQKVLVSQCSLGRGGTWSGSTRNLKNHWSAVLCFDDGSEGALELQNRGAKLITADSLQNLSDL